jgi:short-subunit dehydrogenase
MDLKLKGRNALVTGASKGIGFAVAEALAGEGCHLQLVARTQADLESARDRIASRHHVKIDIHSMDLAERGRAKELAARCPRSTSSSTTPARFRAAPWKRSTKSAGAQLGT